MTSSLKFNNNNSFSVQDKAHSLSISKSRACFSTKRNTTLDSPPFQKRKHTILAALGPESTNLIFTSLAVDGNVAISIGGGMALVGLATALIITDPQNRRSKQMEMSGGDEMGAVQSYFNSDGFERWRKIYSDTNDVNKVQLDIREGHAQTIDKVLKWIDEEGNVKNNTYCDCGCGTGSLAIPLALRGAVVTASDISAAMVNEARIRFEAEVEKNKNSSVTTPIFLASDLESTTGSFDTVTCLDVLIHYPQEKANDMISHLAELSKRRLILSFAPKTPFYSFLKRVGELFPGPSKATRAYLHTEADVEEALNRAGFSVVKREMTATQFYFSRLLEAVKND